MAKAKRDEQEGFEKSLSRLEEIAARLEGGEIPLEDMIKLYEEGIRIQKSCAAMLAGAKLKIEELTQELENKDVPARSSAASAPTEAVSDDDEDSQEEIPF